MTLSELATLLKASPKSWDDLTAQQKLDFINTLAPINGFDGQQRPWFKDWWLVCTQVQEDSMNALLPANVRVKTVLYLSVRYLNIDIVTDCLTAGAMYAAARPILRTLICTNVTVVVP